MARTLGPKCKLCRAEGMKLFIKGERCFSDKCAFSRKSYRPGLHGQKRERVGEFKRQLREKQKVKRIYGILEKQFRRYYAEAVRKEGISGHNLLRLLELRLDNVVYRMGFAPSRPAARQFVRHNHILVNGKKVNIPSYGVSKEDIITIKEKSSKIPVIVDCLERNKEVGKLVSWLSVDYEKIRGKVVDLPTRDDIALEINEQLIIELYSK